MLEITHIKVTVIIPAFNAEPYIQQALESVLNQTEQNLEVIICDDCSTDNTVTVIQSMINIDNRIKLLKNTHNKGPSYSRNRAITEAKGDWIAILDADDFYHKDRLKALLLLAESNQADMVADNICYVDVDGNHKIIAIEDSKLNSQIKVIDAKTYIENDLPTTTSFNYGFLQPIIRTAFLKENQISYDESTNLGEDFILCAELLIKGAKFILTKHPYYYYRVVDQSFSRSGDNQSYHELLNNNAKLIHYSKSANNHEITILLEIRQKSYADVIIFNQIIEFIKQKQFYLAITKLLSNQQSWLTCMRLGHQYLIKGLTK